MPRRPAPVIGQNEAVVGQADAAAKVRWHREFPARPHPKGWPDIPGVPWIASWLLTCLPMWAKKFGSPAGCTADEN
jgi:hypothetical protein